jgi:hypothetical protein
MQNISWPFGGMKSPMDVAKPAATASSADSDKSATLRSFNLSSGSLIYASRNNDCVFAFVRRLCRGSPVRTQRRMA